LKGGALRAGLAAFTAIRKPGGRHAHHPLRTLVFHAADRAVKRVIVGGDTIYASGRPTKLNVADAAGILAESQAKMLRDSVRRDYRGLIGDEISPISLPLH
jgi:5-methylthioadenosine/S-adenosylhomocysteine deaminase